MRWQLRAAHKKNRCQIPVVPKPRSLSIHASKEESPCSEEQEVFALDETDAYMPHSNHEGSSRSSMESCHENPAVDKNHQNNNSVLPNASSTSGSPTSGFWRGAGFWMRSRQRGGGHRKRDNNSSSINSSMSVVRGKEEDDPIRFEDSYRLKHRIVQGLQSVLWECECRVTGHMYLVKVFSWSRPEDKLRVQNELDILSRIQENHNSPMAKNLVRVVRVFYGQNTVHVVLLVNHRIPGHSAGVDYKLATLQSLVLREGRLPEAAVKIIIQTVLRDLEHLHNMGICCNQILPSSIVTTSVHHPEFDYQIPAAILVDFGSATISAMTGQTANKNHGMVNNGCCCSFDDELLRKRYMQLLSGSLLNSAFVAPELLRFTSYPSHPLSCARIHSGFDCNDHHLGSLCSCCGSCWGACDLWSLGVLVHYCLLGHAPPFLDYYIDSQKDLLRSHQGQHLSEGGQPRRGHQLHHSDGVLYLGGCGMSGNQLVSLQKCERNGGIMDYNSRCRNAVSRQARQFMSSCLHQDPTIRMTIQEAFLHPWIEFMHHEQHRQLPVAKPMMTDKLLSVRHRQRSAESLKTPGKQHRPWWTPQRHPRVRETQPHLRQGGNKQLPHW